MNDLKSKLDTILNNQARQPTAQVQSVGYDTQSLISEMRDGLNHVKQNYAQVIQKLAEKQPCSTNCVSLLTVIVVVTVQMIVLLGYFFYRYAPVSRKRLICLIYSFCRDNKDSQAKKFY